MRVARIHYVYIIELSLMVFVALSYSRYKFVETGITEAESGPHSVLQKSGT